MLLPSISLIFRSLSYDPYLIPTLYLSNSKRSKPPISDSFKMNSEKDSKINTYSKYSKSNIPKINQLLGDNTQLNSKVVSSHLKSRIEPIKVGDLLKDFIDSKNKLKRGEQLKYSEPLPMPEKLNLFSISPEEFVNTPTVASAVHDTIEDLELSLYRSKSTTNKYEELMQWTLDGKLWRFPIDNEQDWDSELQTSFHEHIFIDRFLDRDTKKPLPLTAFLELVCAGLSQNPYIGVQQKKEHVEWFKAYFADKVQEIETAVEEEKQLIEKDSIRR